MRNPAQMAADNDIRRDYDDFSREAGNFTSHCQTMGNRVLHTAPELAGKLYVLRELAYRAAQDVLILWGSLLPPILEPAQPPKRGGGRKPNATTGGTATAAPPTRCRHDWGAPATPGGPPVCAKCGNPKSAQGRKAAGAPPTATVDGVTKVDPPSRPLPGLDVAAAERFADGGVANVATRGARR